MAEIKNFKSISPALSIGWRVGTSGYSYTEWIESGFYPPDTPSGKMLALYSEKFSAVELNHTWYQMPQADMIERQRQQAPGDFVFAVKLTRTLTHDVDSAQWRGQAAKFRQGIAPLLQARQLAAVLIQWPAAFDRSAANRTYLAALLSDLEGLPLAVEFRHSSWVDEKVFSGLAQRRVSLVAVDEPALPGLVPPLDVVTNPELAYIRFHGRNLQGWQNGKTRLQFDYDYSATELAEWEPRLLRMAQSAPHGLLFFNNHVRGQAPRNAQSMRRIIKQQAWPAF